MVDLVAIVKLVAMETKNDIGKWWILWQEWRWW